MIFIRFFKVNYLFYLIKWLLKEYKITHHKTISSQQNLYADILRQLYFEMNNIEGKAKLGDFRRALIYSYNIIKTIQSYLICSEWASLLNVTSDLQGIRSSRISKKKFDDDYAFHIL